MTECACGCGQPTPIATKTSSAKGHVQGLPTRFARGHRLPGHKRSPRPDNVERNRARTRHGHTRDHKRSPTWISWTAMHARCANPGNDSWRHYGGRGITVCEAWRSFDAFLADMGERPDGRTLDRINPDGNYEPGNCRWATPREQTLNRRPQIKEA